MNNEREIPKILIVDASSDDVHFLMRALDQCNDGDFTMEGYHDGQTVLDYLFHTGKFAETAPSRPNLIISSLKLPRLDGFEVLKVIKTSDQLKTIPVVILTDCAAVNTMNECYELGANAIIKKPLDFNHLIRIAEGIKAFWIDAAYIPRLPD